MPLPGIIAAAAGILGPVKDIIGKFVADPEKKQEAELALASLEADTQTKLLEFEASIVREQASVIRAEAEAGGLAAVWRPIVMLMFAAIIFNNYLLFPYLDAGFGWGVMLDTPPDLWALMKIGLGGYVVGRSAEKIVKNWKS